MTIDPFGAEIRDGRLWGRGASDTKGSMAAMLWALSEMRERLPHLSHEIWFAGLMGEEVSQHGSRALAAEEHFDFVIAGEPTGLDAVYTHKGSAFVNLRTHGRSAHGARPELGENAIEKMLDVLTYFRGEFAAECASHSDPVLGASTLSIGTIRGGSKTNIIPDSCEASVDWRIVPSQYRPTIIEELAASLRRICPRRRGGCDTRAAAVYRSESPHAAKARGVRGKTDWRSLVLRCVLFCREGDAVDRSRAGFDRPGAHGRRVDRDC
jgi:acetylornithine deacetylase/succinyl-diaminopimelate desuccinylase-like protein